MLRSRQKFGDPYEKATSKETATQPGPGQYKLDGKFLIGDKAPKYTFPKTPLPSIKATQAPGPGAYDNCEGLGKQVLSTKTTAENIYIQKAERQGIAPKSITDVGPGEYGAPPAACEDQVDSRKRTAAKIKFGGGYVKGNKKLPSVSLSEPVPGPGAYASSSGSIGTESMVFKNVPKASLSGRNSFGSPWPKG